MVAVYLLSKASTSSSLSSEKLSPVESLWRQSKFELVYEAHIPPNGIESPS